MNDVIKLADSEASESLRTVGYVSYLLHTIVAVGAAVPGFQPGVFLLVVAFLVDLIKRDDARGSWQESHFSWRIRTVIWAAFWYAITFPLFLLLYLPGALAWGIISIWFLYRVLRGFFALNDGKPMPR